MVLPTDFKDKNHPIHNDQVVMLLYYLSIQRILIIQRNMNGFLFINSSMPENILLKTFWICKYMYVTGCSSPLGVFGHLPECDHGLSAGVLYRRLQVWAAERAAERHCTAPLRCSGRHTCDGKVLCVASARYILAVHESRDHSHETASLRCSLCSLT